MENVLDIKNLNVSFKTVEGFVHAVRGVSLQVQAGEIVALVGESGCGKSALAQAIVRLHADSTRVEAEVLRVAGADVLQAPRHELSHIRGMSTGMIFQDPMSSLNPSMRVGKQITEVLRRRNRWSKEECKQEAVRLLKLVQVPEPEQRASQYPHELSGGMRQRVMIAMAMAGEPKLLIADEPTTALDVTTQLEILRLLLRLREQTGMAILFITHDLGVVAHLADRVAVMYAGEFVEEASAASLFTLPQHPYTQGLLASLPRVSSQASAQLKVIPGSPPTLRSSIEGCAFAPRCEQAMRICTQNPPDLFDVGLQHQAACWLLHPQYPQRSQNGFSVAATR